MARLVGLPEWQVLQTEIASRPKQLRIGQYVWNKYGQSGIDGNTLQDLFYADDEKSIQLLRSYYGFE